LALALRPLNGLRAVEINVSGKFARSKIAWKLATYQHILLHRLIARRGMLELALKSGLTPVVWTVDDPRWVQRAKRLGIHALITNTPEKLLARVNR